MAIATRVVPYVKSIELGRPKDTFSGDRVIQIGPDRVYDALQEPSLSPDTFAPRPYRRLKAPRTVEIRNAIDTFFGYDTTERYKASSCASGDRTISCADIKETEQFTYSSFLFGCNPGCWRINPFQCKCNREVVTGKECECERTIPGTPPEQAPGPVGGGIGGALPIGAAGTTVVQQEGKRGSPLGVILLVVGIIAIGYFLYTRTKGGRAAIPAPAA